MSIVITRPPRLLVRSSRLADVWSRVEFVLATRILWIMIQRWVVGAVKCATEHCKVNIAFQNCVVAMKLKNALSPVAFAAAALLCTKKTHTLIEIYHYGRV